HSSFTPLCITIDGLVGNEIRHFMGRLTDRLTIKWDLQYSTTLNWIRARLLFALIRATNLCLTGSKSKWRGLHTEDGTGINPLHFY
uniref:Uncharacterized protein n=1 Tax=Amphimedon queenslandica TaxID=400682 RepID=A0A1X7VJ95_AMPQE